MSVEPGVLDANILAYAVNADAPRHAASRPLLDEADDPSTRLYVTSQILCEFYSLITNPRKVAVVSSPSFFSKGSAEPNFSYLGSSWYSCVGDSGSRGCGMDAAATAPPGDRRRCIRFANRGDHAGAWDSANLYLQHRRF